MRTYRLGILDDPEVVLIHVDDVYGELGIDVKNETQWAILQMRFEEVKADVGAQVEAPGEESRPVDRDEKKPPERKPKPRRRKQLAGGGEQGPGPASALDISSPEPGPAESREGPPGDSDNNEPK